MKTAVFLLVLLLIGGSAWWLWDYMPDQGWIRFDEQDQAQLVAEGWRTLLHAWPVALVGAVVGLALSSLTLPWLVKAAVSTDEQLIIRLLRHRLDDANEYACGIEAQIRRELEEERNRLDQVAHQLNRQQESLNLERSELENRVRTAERNARDAAYRARNAIHAANRVKRKFTSKTVSEP